MFPLTHSPWHLQATTWECLTERQQSVTTTGHIGFPRFHRYSASDSHCLVLDQHEQGPRQAPSEVDNCRGRTRPGCTAPRGWSEGSEPAPPIRLPGPAPLATGAARRHRANPAGAGTEPTAQKEAAVPPMSPAANPAPHELAPWLRPRAPPFCGVFQKGRRACAQQGSAGPGRPRRIRGRETAQTAQGAP